MGIDVVRGLITGGLADLWHAKRTKKSVIATMYKVDLIFICVTITQGDAGVNKTFVSGECSQILSLFKCWFLK